MSTTIRRVVVLGAGGFVGGAIVRALGTAKVPVLALGSGDVDLSAPDAAVALAARFQDGDALVFASAITRDKGRDAATFVRNIAMGAAVVTALEQSNCSHVVYLSSDAVYGSVPDRPITEDSPCEPDDTYGLMHLTRERLLALALGPRATPLATLRLSIVYGADDTHVSYGPNRFMREIENEGALTLFGGGEEQRDHVYVEDVAALVLAVLQRLAHGTLNVATGEAVSFSRVADAFDRAAGRAWPRRSRPRVLPLVHRRFDVARLRQAFPDCQWTAIDAGVRRTLAARAGRGLVEHGPTA